MHIKNAWYVAAWSSDIPGHGLFARKLFGEDIVFFRTEAGTLAALQDRCAHRAAPLSCGKHQGGSVRCMYHGLVFDASGRCTEVPGQKRISDQLKVRSYPVEERDGLVWLWPGDPAAADPALIFRATAHDSPDWKVELGNYSKFAAGHQLVADNLLDFSHLAFVHIATIGNAQFAESRPTVERGNDWIRVSHFNAGISPSPNNRAVTKLPDMVDRAQVYTWYLKGNIFDQYSAVAPANTGGFDSKAPETVRKRTYIMVTPETEVTCHYFWSAAHNDYLTDVVDVTAKGARKLAAAFEEDRAIIEAQQRVLSGHPDTVMQPIAVDANLLEVRRMVERLIAAESGGSAPAARTIPLHAVAGAAAQ
jgi:phenylpropionate dioxygenase-like ring-hydroxylating dioxygenase large terminal subunit